MDIYLDYIYFAAYGNNVQLDTCIFHESAKVDNSDAPHVVTICPQIGEVRKFYMYIMYRVPVMPKLPCLYMNSFEIHSSLIKDQNL